MTDPTLSEIMERYCARCDSVQGHDEERPNWCGVCWKPRIRATSLVTEIDALRAQVAALDVENVALKGPGGKGWAERAVRMEAERDAALAKVAALEEAERVRLFLEVCADPPRFFALANGLPADFVEDARNAVLLLSPDEAGDESRLVAKYAEDYVPDEGDLPHDPPLNEMGC